MTILDQIFGKPPRMVKNALLALLLALLLLGCRADEQPTITSPAPTTIGTIALPTKEPSATPTGPASSTPVSTAPSTATTVPTSTPTPTAEPRSLRFAVIGDYGQAGEIAATVAGLVKSWNPQLIITTGDNNYPNGAAGTIDDNIGQYYAEFIHPYQGEYGPGAQENRFFPSLGNHDWQTADLAPYLDYFTLPGNERYYDFVRDPVHFFALDSDSREPDGVSIDSVQAQWLRERLTASQSPWRIVYMHHAAYSSGRHGSTEWMRWPFAEWGASVILAGHDHVYERLEVEGLSYITNGLGGHPARYVFLLPRQGSQVRYNDEHGALLVEATEKDLLLQFIAVSGEVIDTYRLVQE